MGETIRFHRDKPNGKVPKGRGQLQRITSEGNFSTEKVQWDMFNETIPMGQF